MKIEDARQLCGEKSGGMFSEKGKTGLFIALGLVMVVSTALSYQQFTRISSAGAAYRQANSVLDELGRMRSLLLSLSSSERDTASTGGASNRDVRTHTADEIRYNLDILALPLREEPEQQKWFVWLSDLTRKRLEFAGSMTNSQPLAGMVGASDDGGLSNEIGAVLSEMEQGERNRIWRIDTEFHSSARIVISAATTDGMAALAIVLLALAGMRREIARRRRTEERVRDLQRTAELAGELVTIMDRRGRIEYVNKAVEETTGYTRNELVDGHSGKWLPWHADEKFQSAMRAAVLSGQTFRAAAAGRAKTGKIFCVDEVITPLEDQTGNVVRIISTGKDITRQRELEDRLAYLDKHDLLTGLPNRSYLAELLGQEILGAQLDGHLLSVLIIDIDQFKHICDLVGPTAGDEVIKQVADRLRAVILERDILARLGSDEFCVIHFDDTRPVVATAVAENIRTALAKNLRVGEHDIVPTVSIGIAVYPDDGDQAHKLLTNADLALDKAKTLGRNSIQSFDENITRGVSELFFLERRLFQALKRDEYHVHYQPYCDLETKKVFGTEALIRWKNGDLGMVPPSRFIPSLENTGMIIDVGKWVLETACSQISKWEQEKKLFPVSVNLSLIQFHHQYLVSIVSDTIKAFKLDPRRLTLEVTESVFIQDMDFAVRILKQLKDLGVLLSIDDFGTGYSSLSYLKRLPVDNIKIDISFVRDVAKDPDVASIITAITTLARSLNLKTIAEGIETEEQRNILRLLRCDMDQGFYFSPALPVPEFESYLALEQQPLV